MTTSHDDSFENAVHTLPDQNGQTLSDLSAEQPVLLIFLRHAGCTFCREALSDVARQRSRIEATGTRLAFVHMSSPERADALFLYYGLEDVSRFSDPEQHLYRAFDLKNGRFSQLLGPKVLLEGFQAALLRRHGFGLMEGNGFRMPGVFLLKDGKVISSYFHQTAADRPDYAGLACGISEGSGQSVPNTAG